MLERIQAVAAQVGTVVVGKQPQIRLALACLLARGHLLIEDLPGVGKTTAEMKASASYAEWGLTNKWLMVEGQTYPLLRELMVPLLVRMLSLLA